MMDGIILYGPPAAGKDTITRELHTLDSRYVLFPRLKAGRGNTAGYRITTESAIAELRGRNEILWENQRYDSVYIVDRSMLYEQLAQHVPVLHLGQIEAIDAVTTGVPEARWFVVYIWCLRHIAEQRIIARDTKDTEQRLRAWDETTPLPHADLTINTAEVSAQDAAHQIHYYLHKQQE